MSNQEPDPEEGTEDGELVPTLGADVALTTLGTTVPSGGLGGRHQRYETMLDEALDVVQDLLKAPLAPRGAQVRLAAAQAVLDRKWPKPSVSAIANVQVNVLVNGGATAIDRWERRHEEAPHEDA